MQLLPVSYVHVKGGCNKRQPNDVTNHSVGGWVEVYTNSAGGGVKWGRVARNTSKRDIDRDTR